MFEGRQGFPFAGTITRVLFSKPGNGICSSSLV